MSRTDTRRRQDLARKVAQQQPAASSAGNYLIVRTFAKAAYPTAAKAVYACRVVDVSFAEQEGVSVVVTPRTETELFVGNVGTKVPPNGTEHRAYQHNGRWIMEYNG
jgi:hypothetical protein